MFKFYAQKRYKLFKNSQLFEPFICTFNTKNSKPLVKDTQKMFSFCAIKTSQQFIRFGTLTNVGAAHYQIPPITAEQIPGFGNLKNGLIGVRPGCGTSSFGFGTNQAQSEIHHKSIPSKDFIRTFDKIQSTYELGLLSYFSTGDGQAKTDIRNENFQSCLQILRVGIHYNIAIVLVFRFKKKKSCFSKKNLLARQCSYCMVANRCLSFTICWRPRLILRWPQTSFYVCVLKRFIQGDLQKYHPNRLIYEKK